MSALERERGSATRPRLVIFDCDGVLVDSEPISNAVLAEMLGEQGWKLTVAETRARFQGMLLSEIGPEAQRELARPLPTGWLEEYVARRAAVFDAELRPVPGAAQLVERVVDAGLPVCIASQGSLAKIARSLALTGLERWFPPGSRFSADDVPRGKPQPDLFLHAAVSSGADPGSCAVVEDTPSGVAAAVAAGMSVYGFCADSDEPALREAGARTAASLAEIGDMLLDAEASG